jgi:hypothetical protein
MEIPIKLNTYEYGADELSLDELKDNIRIIHKCFSSDELTDNFLNNLENLLYLLCDSGLCLWRSYTDLLIVEKFQEYIKEYIIRHLREDSCYRGKKETIEPKWRIPSVDDFRQVYEDENEELYNSFHSEFYWTSDTFQPGSVEFATIIHMGDGTVKTTSKDDNFYRYRFCKDIPIGLEWSPQSIISPSKMYVDVIKILEILNSQEKEDK